MAVHQEGPGNGAPDLASRYASAFAAYLRDRGEQGLGAAYDLGREAVAAHLSVLDLAEAHHAALRGVLEAGSAAAHRRHAAGGRGLPAREPVDLRERPPRLHRGPGGRAARARPRPAAALAGRRVRGDQLLDDGAGDPPADGRRRARDPRRRPRERRRDGLQRAPAAADGHLAGAARARAARPVAAVGAADAAAATSSGRSTSWTAPGATTARATARSSTSSPASPPSRSPTRASTTASARSPARSSAACAPARCPRCRGSRAAVRFRPAGENIELGGDFYDLFKARDGGYAALIGDVQGKGPDAAAVTALARHTLRAAAEYEHSPSAVLTLLHRALREQRSDDRFITVAYAHMQVAVEHVRLELACGGHPLPLDRAPRRQRGRASAGSAPCWAPTSTRCWPTSRSSWRWATCSCSTRTA